MKLFLCLVGVTVALVAACAPASVPATTVPTASSQASATAAAGGDASAELASTYAAAKAEGTVTISAPASPLWRQALTSFEQDYPGIQVEYNEADSRDYWPKLAEERQAGQYLWDVRIGGPDPQVYAAMKNGTLDPVRPLFFLPEVTDASKWRGGFDGLFADDAKQYLPGFLASTSPPIWINTDGLPDGAITSELDLTNPEWKGKIVIQDPRGGAGLGFIASFLKVDGEDYLRNLLNQDLIVSGDNRQIAEWLVRDTYPIAIGARNYDLIPYQQQGLAQDVKPVTTVHAVPLSIGSGGIQLINHQPHPNATKLFVNWLLTQKTQSMLVQTIQDNSLRTDVQPGDPSTYPDPSKMDTYVAHQTEGMLTLRTQAAQMAADVLQ